jgi:hypothetical protein
MTSVKKLLREYRTLDEIRERKDELLDELKQDNTKMSTMWNQVFLKRENNTKSDYIASIISNGIVAFDTIMLIRKLMKGYGFLFGKKKQKKSFL